MKRPPSSILPTSLLAALGAVSLLAQVPAVQGTRDLSDAAVKRDVAARVADLGSKGTFSGIVVAARGTDPVVVAAAGYADRAAKTPITPSTRFTIGLMGKMFTAAAIGQLVDRGKASVRGRRGGSPALSNGASQRPVRDRARRAPWSFVSAGSHLESARHSHFKM